MPFSISNEPTQAEFLAKVIDQFQRQKQIAEEMKLRKAVFQREDQNSDLQRALMTQQIQGLTNTNEESALLKRAMLGGQGNGQPTNQGISSSLPTQLVGQGLGAFSPEGLNNLQRPPKNLPLRNASQAGLGQSGNGNQPDSPKINWEAVKNNPWLRMITKKHFGFDPAEPVPETPAEKEARATHQAISIDEAKANRKRINDIEEHAKVLFPYIHDVNTIEKILKNKPDLTGPSTDWINRFGLTKDKDVGTLATAMTNLQGKMAKDLSTKSGYGVLNIAQQGKPGIGKSQAFNVGATGDLKDAMHESFKLMKNDYERLNPGVKFPYDFEQYFEEETGASSSDKKKRVKFNRATGRLE